MPRNKLFDLAPTNNSKKIQTMTTIRLAQNKRDIEGIMSLRDQNSIESVGRSHRGFVTCVFPEEVLEECMKGAGIIVSVSPAENVVGYIILMSMMQTEKYYSDLASWYKQRYSTEYESSILNRQYCVHEDYRGGKTVKSLYDYQRTHLLQKGISWSIGEIDPVNMISIVTAQRLLGYCHIGDRADNSVNWWIGRRKE